MGAFVTRTPSKKMRQMSLGGSAIETPLKTGYEGQPGDHNRVMHKFMSNLTNIAQFMPQGIKGPKRLLQQAAMEKWNAIKPKANAGSRSQIEEYLREDDPPPVVHVRAAPESFFTPIPSPASVQKAAKAEKSIQSGENAKICALYAHTDCRRVCLNSAFHPQSVTEESNQHCRQHTNNTAVSTCASGPR